MTNLSKKIKEMREEAEMSPSQLAEKSGLSSAYISKLEDGSYKSLTLRSSKALADGLSLTLKDFLERLGLLTNNERPSFQILISQALRGNGYTDKQAEEVLRYAEILKRMGKSK